MKQAYILLNVRRATIPRLPRKVIEEIEIPILSSEKQKEVVNILDIQVSTFFLNKHL